LVFLACGGSSSTPTGTTINKDIKISTSSQLHVESLGIAKTINAKVSVEGGKKDIYILLSNYSATDDGTVQITQSNKKIEPQKKQTTQNLSRKSQIIHAPKYVEDFRAKIHTLLNKQTKTTSSKKLIDNIVRSEDVVNETKTFYLNSDTSESTVATARKVVSSTSTLLGNKTLNIWVSNDSFGVGCSKKRCVTQSMVNALADSFLKTGLANDIYDWVSNVYGEEWGTQSDSALIPHNNEITILLTDIDKDDSISGGVVGFFSPKDNFKRSELSGSNERVMLYADAVLFANGEGIWGIDDFWPKEMVSTLAHEFQHTIHFYQKTLLRTNGEPSDTWINEMLSETTEDLVATKIKHIGSRGVEHTDGSAGESRNTHGRYPLFNQNNTLSLTTWIGRTESYANVNAFGAYLIRNYGGAKVLHDIMHNNKLDEQAIVSAVNKAANGTDKTFNYLLKEWGLAVLLSDNENLPDSLPKYNTGDFTEDTYNQSTYEMGSINFFNYSPTPNVSHSTGKVQSKGNYYYKVGSNVSGNIEINLRLNGQTEATLIAK
jgi:hypothetical protein